MLPVKTDPIPKRSTSHWGSSRHSKTMLEDSESPGGARDVVCVCALTSPGNQHGCVLVKNGWMGKGWEEDSAPGWVERE